MAGSHCVKDSGLNGSESTEFGCVAPREERPLERSFAAICRIPVLDFAQVDTAIAGVDPELESTRVELAVDAGASHLARHGQRDI
jgi:hypothetical protein